MAEAKATLYVANLPWSTTEDELLQLFGQFAGVLDARVIQDRKTGRSRGYGFVDLASPQEAAAVCATLHGCRLNGRPLEIRLARVKQGGG